MIPTFLYLFRMRNNEFDYQQQGVTTEFVTITPDQPSGVATIIVDGAGSNQIIIVDGANGHLSPVDVDAASGLISQARVMMCQLEVPVATTMHAMKTGKAAGLITILNPVRYYLCLPNV